MHVHTYVHTLFAESTLGVRVISGGGGGAGGGREGGGGGGTKEGAVEQKQQMQRLVSPTHTGESTYNTPPTCIVCAKGQT